jgi:hypothetical protein
METPAGLTVLIMALVAVSIWASVRAKPLAGKHYRWATLTGIYVAFTALTFPYANYYRFPNLRLLALAVGCCAAISSFGILRRRKFGVVMYAATYLLIVLFMLGAEGLSLRTVADLGLTMSVATVTLVYFKRRWDLFPATRPVAAA